jgi:hypothetical protein
MTSSQRVHLQELFDRKHLAVVEAYQASHRPSLFPPDFSKAKFCNFLIEKYQDFIGVPRGTIQEKKS